MPSSDNMQKHERALNGGSLSCEIKKYKATREAESDTYSNKWVTDGFTGVSSTGSLFPSK